MKSAKALAAGLFAALPLGAWADGPYIDVGTGANFSRDQRLYNSAGQSVGTLQYDEGIPGTIAAGYAFDSGWRGDLEFGMRRNDVDDSSTVSEGSVDAGTMMAMLWFDWPFAWAVRPYAGAGAGQAELELNDAGAAGGESDNVFAWQLAMGLASRITPRLAVHLGYRLVTADDAQFSGSGLRTDYQADSLMLGLRYYFKPVQNIRMADAAAAQRTQGPAVEAAAFETLTLRGVNFRFDESVLTEPARQTLDRIAEDLLKEPGTRIVIEGHTDFLGTPDYNIALGERRANTVRDYLVSKGVSPSAIETRTYGETQPAAENDTPDGRAANRRAEFVAESTPPDVRVVIEPPTEASKRAAQAGEDPRIEQAPQGDGATPQEPAPTRE